MRLNLETFDETPFLGYLLRCEDAGIEFATMASVGDELAHRRRLYELNKTCAADIPGRGEFETYAAYVAKRFETAAYDPAGVVIAEHDGDWIGMAAMSVREPEVMINEMTGVVASHRGKGISIAMKLRGIRYARSRSATALVTRHRAGNATAIAMNQRLGYVDIEPPTWVSR